MATSDLIDKLRGYLELSRKKQEGRHEKLRSLLKKLKKKQRKLEKMYKTAPDAKARKRIKNEMKVLYVQRKKGVKLYRAIREKD